MNQTPLRNEAVEHNTKEAFRCLRQWQIFHTVSLLLAILLAFTLIITFAL